MVCTGEGHDMKPIISDKKIEIAEKRVMELIDLGDIKKLSEQTKDNIAQFYESKSRNRLETATLIYSYSSNSKKEQGVEVSANYADYGEVVAASYYAMYYIVHAYLSKKYSMKLREDIRGVHAITYSLIIYYLVKTNNLATHLYEEYLQTMKTTAEIHNISIEDFKEQACGYANKYDESRTAREMFTYYVTKSAEEHHAQHALNIAQEFIGVVRELMMKK